MCVCTHTCAFLACFDMFCLLSIFVLFIYFLRGKEHEIEWLGRWGKIWDVFGMEENMIRIYRMNKTRDLKKYFEKETTAVTILYFLIYGIKVKVLRY